jgi:hypothetical protein
MSRTLTVVVQVVVIPVADVAVKTTSVIPTGYTPEAFAPPELKLLVIVVGAQASEAVASAKVIFAEHDPGVALTVTPAGHEIVKVLGQVLPRANNPHELIVKLVTVPKDTVPVIMPPSLRQFVAILLPTRASLRLETPVSFTPFQLTVTVPVAAVTGLMSQCSSGL